MAGLTAEGFVGLTEQEIIAAFVAQQRATVDPQLNTTATSPVGQFNGIYGAALAELWEAMQDTVDMMHPSKAVGIWLENIAAITGTRRLQSTKSTVTLTLSLNAGVTVDAGAIVSVDGNPSLRFVTIEGVANAGDAAGEFEVAAESETAGAVFAASGSLTEIETPVSGWTAVTNAEDAVIGRDLETEAALRERRRAELSAIGGGTRQGIVADLLRVAGVTEVLVSENPTRVTSSYGIPPHAFEVLIEGGDDLAVARQIWESKPVGIATFGNTSQQLLDSEGVSHNVRFSRPDLIPLYVTIVVIAYDPTIWIDRAALVDAIKTQVAEATVDRSSTGHLAVSEPAYAQQLARVVLEMPGVYNAYANISIDGLPLSPSPNMSSGTAIPGLRSKLQVQTANISVVLPQ